MRGIVCRGLRLEWVAGIGIGLTMPALALTAQGSSAVATQTTLTAETRDSGGHTKADLSIAVLGTDGLPATGAVTVTDRGKSVAGVALNAQGHAKVAVDLLGGSHVLKAVYSGDSTHMESASASAAVTAQSSAAPDFAVSLAAVSPTTTFPMTLTPGSAGTLRITVTPENNAALTAPMFLTVSCSGLPDQSSCTPTPETLEILSTTTTAPTSTMVIQTEAASTTTSALPANMGKGRSPIAWAILLPGVLGFGGLAWTVRGRAWLHRLSLVAVVGVVTLLGTTACNPLYSYKNHGPDTNRPTPAGTYTITVTAQSSNGVTATNRYSTFVLVVK